MKTYVYVDGFNLYYQIRKTPYKWLNLKAMADHILGAGYTVERVKYYTAHVSGAVDPNDPIKQQMYLRALKTVPEIEAFFGRFMAKPIWRPLLCAPIADRQITPGGAVLAEGLYQVAAVPAPVPPAVPAIPAAPVQHMQIVRWCMPSPSSPATNALKVRVYDTEEKGSDVHLAVDLLHDAWNGKYDAAAVLSNDTDLCEAIRIVKDELKKPVVLLCPTPKGASKPLAAVASSVRHLNHSVLKASQFPDNVPAPAGWKPIVKPANW